MLVPDVIFVCDCYVCMKAREGEREMEKERERAREREAPSPARSDWGLLPAARLRNRGAARGPTSH